MFGKKKISIMIVVILLIQVILPVMTVIIEGDFTLFSIAVEGENSWDISKNGDGSVIATLDENGVMTISGEGEMHNWMESGNRPYRSNQIKEVIIQEGITNIGGAAFMNCNQLTSISIPEGVTSIGERAFSECTKLESIIIPESVTEIRNNAFYFCSSLTNINIPNSVTRIESQIFSCCKKLTNVEIHKNIEELDKSAFEHCEKLTRIDVSNENANFSSIDGVLFNKEQKTLIKYPEGKIENEYSIPEGVQEIGRNAFWNCSNLTSINFPETIKDVYYDSFVWCKLLNNINVSILNNKFSSINGVLFNKEYTTLIKYPEGKTETTYTIPEGVVDIGWDAFINSTRLTNVIIPNGVTIIESGAFRGCSNLTSINIPNSVTEIESGAFHSCKELTSINIPQSITCLEESLFEKCTKLKNITIPKSVEIIEKYVFQNCTELENIVLPNGVTSIGDCAFDGCTKLTSINIPEGVTSIGDYVFYECKSLTNINIPEGVTSIGDNAFYECKSLTDIIIPEGVTKIGDSSFTGCINLEKVIIPDSIEKVGYYPFNKSRLIIPIEENTEEEIMPQILSRAMKEEDLLYSSDINLRNCEMNETGDKIKVHVGDNILINNGKLKGLEIKIVSSGTIGYNEESWVNNNVNSIIHLMEGEEVTNNEKSLFHLFTENGEFTYTYLTKRGEERQVTAVVNNIDKIPPTINKVTKHYDKSNREKYTIEIDAEDDLSGFGEEAYSFDGETNWEKENISRLYSENIEDKEYIENIKIVVKDKAGNITEFTGEIEIVENENTTPEIKDYEIKEDENAKYIKGIVAKTTISTLKEKIQTNGLIEIYKNNQKIEDENTKLGTGMEVIISFTNGENISYTIVVTGDINGDGDVKASDLSKLKNALIGRNELAGAYKEAADTNGDGNLKASDLSKLKKMIIGQ